MPGAQPSGLREFVRARGYHSLYFLRVQPGEPIKIGITHDPASRLSALQNANWRPVSFDRLWWLPGHPIAARIEAALKLQFLPSTSAASGSPSTPLRPASSWKRQSSGSAPGGSPRRGSSTASPTGRGSGTRQRRSSDRPASTSRSPTGGSAAGAKRAQSDKPLNSRVPPGAIRMRERSARGFPSGVGKIGHFVSLRACAQAGLSSARGATHLKRNRPRGPFRQR